MNKTASNTSSVPSIAPTISPNYAGSGYLGNTYQYSPHQVPGYEVTLGDPWAMMPQIDGLDELCEMLGVSEGGQPPLLTGVSGVRYSLVNVLRAQMELMVRLNILLVHRRLVPDE